MVRPAAVIVRQKCNDNGQGNTYSVAIGQNQKLMNCLQTLILLQVQAHVSSKGGLSPPF